MPRRANAGLGGISRVSGLHCVFIWGSCWSREDPSTLGLASAKKLEGADRILGIDKVLRKFIHGYNSLASPLTALIKKNAFQWSETAQLAFENLKEALSSPPVLALLNFSLPFVVECDVSATRICVVLIQNNHPIAYINQKLKNPEKIALAYEGEMLGSLFAVKKWR